MFTSLRTASHRLLAGLVAAGGLLAASHPAAAQWTVQNSNLPTGSGVIGISIADASNVWAAGFDPSSNSAYNTYTRTTNGGTTWVSGTIAAAASQNLSSVSAVSGTTAWIGSNSSTAGGFLYYTTNGGTTWTRQLSTGFTTAKSGYINGVAAFSSTNVVAVGDPVSATGAFEIYTTTDAGTTWTPATTPNATGTATAPEYGNTSVVTVPGPSATARSCWMGTNTGRVLRSTDSGKTWTAATTGLASVTSVAFCSTTNGIAMNVDSPNIIAYTLDGGATWRTRVPTGPAYALSAAGVPGQTNTFVSASLAVTALGTASGSSYSVDGGATWVAIDNVPHYTVAFLNGTTGWSGGFATSPTVGGMFKGTLPASALATTPALAAAEVAIYPNPASGAFAVQVAAVAGATQAEARLYNALGQEVARRAAALPAGGVQLDFSTSALAPGIYTLRVQAGAASTTRQVSVL